MMDRFFTQPELINRLRLGPLGPYLDQFAASLQEQGFAPAIIRRYLHGADCFGHWLSSQGLGPADAHEATVQRYHSTLSRDAFGDLPAASYGLKWLVRLLRQKQIVTYCAPPAIPTPTEQWLERFERHLRDVAGASGSTVQHYRRSVKRFLARFGDQEPDWSAVRTEDLTEFVQQQGAACSRSWSTDAACALRALLRFLVSRGQIRPGMEIAIPLRSQRLHAALPRHLTPEEVEKVLAGCQDGTAKGVRDFAMLLLLARLGIRAGEVTQLRLEDIDWRQSRLLIRAQKTHRERTLPLSSEIGNALAAYLQRGRPSSTSRFLFLRSKAPVSPLTGSCAVYAMARDRLLRAGYPAGPRAGSHLFRHTVATRMVRGGASFKEVADVLGHRSLTTTALYAKLDIESLSRVAMPWPGGAQ